MQSNKATDAYGLGIRFQTESQDHCIHGLVLAPRNALRNEATLCLQEHNIDAAMHLCCGMVISYQLLVQ